MIRVPSEQTGTVDPPVDWISNDPFGPYDTLAELRKDTFDGYREQDAEEAAAERWE